MQPTLTHGIGPYWKLKLKLNWTLDMPMEELLCDDRKEKRKISCKDLFASAFRVHVAAASVQILYAAFQVLAKAALSSGTSRSVFPVYRNAIAALVIAPLAFFSERLGLQIKFQRGLFVFYTERERDLRERVRFRV